MNSTTIVVPNWNGLHEIEACLDSLKDQSLEITIIVVDNGSTDGSLELIREKYKEIVVLAQPKNLGFAGGVNVGIRYALEHNFSYIGLFNSDAVADKEWARSLTKTLDTDTSAGIVTSLLLHGDGKTIDSTGDWYSVWGLPFPRARNQDSSKAPSQGYVFGASGGASLYRAGMLRDIGLFDEAFFAYYEDVDISFRAQLAGWKVAYNPVAIAYHTRGVASNKIPGFTVYQAAKNLPLLYLKNVPSGLLLSIGARFYLAYALILANMTVHGNGVPAFKGFIRTVLLTPHALNLRRHIQGSKKVDTAYIKGIIWPDLPPEQTGLRKFRKFFTGKS